VSFHVVISNAFEEEQSMAVPKEKRQASTAGQAIKTYRQVHGITQKQLAIELGVEARTLRMYENGERALDNITDLQRIADLLAIDPEMLGLSAKKHDTYTHTQIYEVIKRVWSLIPQARLIEALTSINTLLQNVRPLATSEDIQVLYTYACAHIVAGYVKSLTCKTIEAAQVIQHFHEAARIACVIDDHTLFSIALSQHGEILRRQNKLAQSIAQLENAHTNTPRAHLVAQGNNARLLARVYLSNNDLSNFEKYMLHAMQLAQITGAAPDHTLTLHCQGMIYDDYARGYGRLGKLEKSLRYLALAESHLPADNLWDMMLKASRTEALIYSGAITEGMQFAVEVAHLAQMYGHQRLLERLYRLQCYMDDRSLLMSRASRALNDVLHGQAEP
jgi:transcriptional regulator with XRE-family HTH domain